MLSPTQDELLRGAPKRESTTELLGRGPDPNQWKPPVEQGEIVRCLHCKRIHLAASNEYLAVYGNVMIGQSGLIGNNLGPDGKVLRSSIFCLTPECLAQLFNRIMFPVKDTVFVKEILRNMEKAAEF